MSSNLIFGKINVKIPVPPAYSREVWDYKNANAEGMQKSISRFHWKKAFENLSINEKVDFLNATLVNIFRNYIPNKIVKCSYRDPPWLTKLIKSKLKERSKISSECSNLIINAKMGYIQKKSNALNDKNTDPKLCWTILNNFLNNIKISSIPAILASGKTITNIVEKTNLFNNFFASQCTRLENASKLPPLLMKTDKRLNTISFKDSDITSIIKSLKPTKAHGGDNISVRMIQLCGDSITHPLTLIFKFSFRNGIFPATWKMTNAIPVHKKEEKNRVKNYRSFAKVFERLLFNSLFAHFHDNDLFTKCQSGFMPGDSCIFQLLSIVREIQSSFYCNPPVDTRAIFLDISKAFDKAWHQGLFFKLKSDGVEGSLFCLLENYLENRKQRVILHGQCSSWKNIVSGVSQGSVLGPLLFLIYINDLLNGLVSICKIFADDTSIFSKVFDKHSSQNILNNDLSIISEWAFQWKMQFNPDANKQAIRVYLPVDLNNSSVQLCESQSI